MSKQQWMNKHRWTISLTLFILITALFISACNQASPVINPAPEHSPHNQTGIEPNPGQSEDKPDPQAAIVAMAMNPEQLVLSPGAQYQLSLQAMYSDQSVAALDSLDEIQLASSDPQTIEVLPDGRLQVADEAIIGKTVSIQAEYDHMKAEMSVTVSYSLEDTITFIEDGLDQVTNPDSIAVVVNKQRSLPKPDQFVPKDLTKPNIPFSFSGENERNYMRAEAAAAIEALFTQAKEDNIRLVAVSGYRSYGTQKAIYENNLRTKGEEHTKRYSAYPGTSEHQTGLTMDVSSASVNYALEEVFGETEEGKWLAENAPDFGFIIRYPQGKEDITGYAYEPWHIRFVGIDLAQAIRDQGVTMEEYFAATVPVSQNVD